MWKRKILNYNCPKANLMKIKLEKYIEKILDKSLTNFRISNHELSSEKGKYKEIRKEERHCETCKTKALESE